LPAGSAATAAGLEASGLLSTGSGVEGAAAGADFTGSVVFFLAAYIEKIS